MWFIPQQSFYFGGDYTNQYDVVLDDYKVPFLLPTRVLVGDNICNNDEKVVELLNRNYNLDSLADEFMYEVALNTKSHVLGVFEIAHGTVNQMLVSPREVFQKALLVGAVAIILVHNHPSGNTAPSLDDKMIVKRIKEAGSIIGIDMLSFLIVGKDTFGRIDG